MHHKKPGILLVNLGTPDAPTPGAIKRYLLQFLSDRRHARCGFPETAVVAAAARRDPTHSRPARGETLSIRLDGRGITADGL